MSRLEEFTGWARRQGVDARHVEAGRAQLWWMLWARAWRDIGRMVDARGGAPF